MTAMSESNGENGETVVSVESWQDLPEEYQSKTNSDFKKNGVASQVFDKCLLLTNISDERYRQVNIALKYAIAPDITSWGERNFSLGAQTEGKNDSSSRIVFMQPVGADQDTTVQNINKLVEQANEMLESFDRPKIPTLASQG
jgi:hypothetical protein